jgi:hypothetical protein
MRISEVLVWNKRQSTGVFNAELSYCLYSDNDANLAIVHYYFAKSKSRAYDLGICKDFVVLYNLILNTVIKFSVP